MAWYRGEAARRSELVRTAKGRRAGMGRSPALKFDRSQKTRSRELIQPGPIKPLSSNSQAVEGVALKGGSRRPTYPRRLSRQTITDLLDIEGFDSNAHSLLRSADLPRDRDHELPVPAPLAPGERVVGEIPFRPEVFSSFSDTIIETGLPFSRQYDAAEELDRIRQHYAREAAGARASRPRPAPFRHHTMRRV